MFAAETFDEMRRVRMTALCGSLAAVLIGWGPTDRLLPGIQSSGIGDNSLVGDSVVPTARTAMDWELRRGWLPMELNEAVESWVLRLTSDRKSVFEYALSRAGLYSDMIRAELRERGMPEELLYLALVESDFHTDARSRVRATGMWQFMEPTARLYGLRIDAYVDERYDPIRATAAALDHRDGEQLAALHIVEREARAHCDIVLRRRDGGVVPTVPEVLRAQAQSGSAAQHAIDRILETGGECVHTIVRP